MATLFVYGTLQHPPLLARLLGRVPPTSPAELAGHRAAPLRGRVYPGLVVDGSATADGRVVEVTDDELEILDAFEGSEYVRRDVVVTLADGVSAPAQAWLLVGPSVELVEDGQWSFERFLAADVAAFLDRSARGRPHPGAGS